MTTEPEDDAKPHVHVFDPVSGYCVRGCPGYREDGRVVHKSGSVFRAGANQLNRSES